MSGWKRVSFYGDAKHEDGCDGPDCCTCDPRCSVRGELYGECPCPGPTMDDHEYRERRGVLYAREVRE